MGTCLLTVHSYVIIHVIADLTVFTPGTQLNIYALSNPVILGHWIGSNAVGWLQLLIYGMAYQQT